MWDVLVFRICVFASTINSAKRAFALLLVRKWTRISYPVVHYLDMILCRIEGGEGLHYSRP